MRPHRAASAVTQAFCWIGAAGYRVEGTITCPAAAGRLLTENEVEGFAIAGWRDDASLGDWSLADLTPETSFTLRFDTRTLAFAMGGYPEESTYQEWNADGLRRSRLRVQRRQPGAGSLRRRGVR